MEVIFNFNNFTSNSFLIRHKHSADKFNSEGSLWIFFQGFSDMLRGINIRFKMAPTKLRQNCQKKPNLNEW